SRAAVQDRLVDLCFQRGRTVGTRLEGSEERRGPRQVALRLCDSRLCCEGVDVVRHNIENLVKLSQRFGETTKCDIGLRMRCEYGYVARVKPLGFVEVRLAPVPLASPPCDVGQRFRNSAAIRQELTCLFKVTHCSVVVLETG